jgi:4a-hydroxytetrahydrobiopterin dehydratase
MSNWTTQTDNKGQTLVREFRFLNYAAGLAFVNQVAALAETAKHHPDIFLQYCRVTVSLTTHDAGNVVTEQDYSLAGKIDAIAPQAILDLGAL